ncbi:unnamed protein product [Prorocentrum cordatum]|uniref:Uncharacterized protein n=1 Tax=Prorocentrum cordatum TaxID=2364126 RepID=A0ABN9TRR1_9DINO|nr:unnamed protein product [Polarella glacialis]
MRASVLRQRLPAQFATDVRLVASPVVLERGMQLGSPCRVAAPAEAQEHVPRGRLSTCPSPAGAAMPTRARAHGGGTSRARRGAGEQRRAPEGRG